MKLKILSIILFLNFTFCFSSDVSLDESKIYKNLRCLVCQGQSIADSNSDFAQTIKMVVKDLVNQGKKEDEIYNFLAEKYGDWILYKPKLNAENFLLWSFPYISLVVGGLIIVFFIKKRAKKT
tara:strand:+ start:331 stop:699 length:369 start_codon:yes stop_codon:yes gene_type:complete